MKRNKRFEQTYHQRDINKKQMKRCTTSLVIRKMQIETTMRYHYTPTRIVKIKNKIQHPFMIKNPPEGRHRWNLPQHNKGHIRQTHSQHHSQW